MDSETIGAHDVLERMLLDENAKPMNFTLSLLEDITNRFSVDCQIGSGGFAVVYKGTVGKWRVAVKKLTKTHELPESKFHKEVQCMMKARHRNIVRFLGYCAETQGKAQHCEGTFVMAERRNWLLCFEYVPNGSLEKYITDASSGLEWRQRFGIIKGICHGLHYLHKNGIIHLDLKPSNILLDRCMEPKIADFGLSRYLDQDQTHATTIHLFGTPGYLAQEFFSGKVSFASDIYSLGIIIAEILTGAKGYPVEEIVTQKWMNRLEGDTQLEQVRVCTKISIQCMESDPKKRPVARHIIDMLDKTTSVNQTGTSSSLVGLQVNSLKEQSDEEIIGKLARNLKQKDINEHPETEGFANQGTSILGSNSGVLEMLNVFKFFKRDAQKKSVLGLTIFTMGEINKITRNYSALIGRGNFGIVYKGNLPDGTIVAVKTSVNTSIMVDELKKKYFLEGVQDQAQMVHTNNLKLIGCCLEADATISVYEYAAHGSLHEILHGNKFEMLSLELRLNIAIGSAEGIKYVHSRGRKHGDVNPDSIFLDEHLTPKISHYQLSQLRDGGSLTGSGYIYMDPMLLRTGILTEKNDVYSFGAVLVELITRKKSVYNDNRSLITEYCKLIQIEKSGRAMFDEKITAEEDISVLEEIGQLAVECLKEDVEERPDMLEVTERLVMRLGEVEDSGRRGMQASLVCHFEDIVVTCISFIWPMCTALRNLYGTVHVDKIEVSCERECDLMPGRASVCSLSRISVLAGYALYLIEALT